jgi:Ca-activated chloride channel family protein
MFFQFEQPQYLWLLSLVPLFFILFVWTKKQNAQRLEKLGNSDLVLKMLKNFHPKKEKWCIGLFLGAIFFFCIAFANPQWGKSEIKNTVRQADILMIFDVSKSMLAQDVLPNRLTQSKIFGQKLVEKVKAERIGIMVFAANAHLLMPFSSDFSVAKMYIETLDENTISAQGSSLKEVLNQLKIVNNKNNKRPIVVLLISDGESHDEINLKDFEDFHKQNILFYVLGVGTNEGGFIPDYYGYKKDSKGNQIKTIVNETLLKELAKTVNGSYFNINENQEVVLSEIVEDIKNIGTEGSKIQHYQTAESRFQIFIGLGLLLLLIYIYLKNKTL